MRKKGKKMVRFAYCNRIFMCILCTGSGCVQASQITGKRHTACKQQWEKKYSLEVSAPMVCPGIQSM